MERYRPNTHKIKASTRLSAVTGESMMPKIKEINLDLRKIIIDAHKAGNGYIKLSQRFLDRNRLQEKQKRRLQTRTKCAEDNLENV